MQKCYDYDMSDQAVINISTTQIRKDMEGFVRYVATGRKLNLIHRSKVIGQITSNNPSSDPLPGNNEVLLKAMVYLDKYHSENCVDKMTEVTDFKKEYYKDLAKKYGI
jgi:hypothetical protein